MVTPAQNSTAFIDLNLFVVGSATHPSVDLSLSSQLWRKPASYRAMLAWYVGPTFQGVVLSPEQTHQSGDTLVRAIGARTELVLGFRASSNIRLLASVGLGTHVGMMSTRESASVVSEGEGFLRGAIVFPRISGLPDGVFPMIQGTAGLAVFHPQDGPLTMARFFGGGLGVLCQF